MKVATSKTIERIYPFVLTIGGLLGLIAMTQQATERINMLKNPGADLSCNLSPVVDCSGVLSDGLAAVMGFPNAFLGMIFFAILTTSGLMLLSGGTFTGWFKHFVMAVTTVLLLFSVWFFGVSLYVLGKICVFCVVGWAVSIPMFWYGLLYYLHTAGGKIAFKTASFAEFGRKHHLDVVLTLYAVALFLFLFRFRDYYFS
jgi:uncharacterized membrane protein